MQQDIHLGNSNRMFNVTKCKVIQGNNDVAILTTQNYYLFTYTVASTWLSLPAQEETATHFASISRFGAKSFCQNRSINPLQPIRIHFHSDKNVLKDDWPAYSIFKAKVFPDH